LELNMPKQNQSNGEIPRLPALGLVTFTAPRNATPYEGRRGVRSIMVARAILPLATIAGDVEIECGVWGRLVPTTDGTDFSVEAALPKNVSAERDTQNAVLSHVERRLQAWSGFGDAWDAAYGALTGAKKPGERPKLAKPEPKPEARPALVKPNGQRVRATSRPVAASEASDGAQPSPDAEIAS
jgi:hypothetical protein